MVLSGPARRRRSQGGQAVTEYILLLVIVVGGFMILSRGMARIGLSERLLKPVREDFARAYRYGHPKALGFEDGGPRNHPRIVSGSDNNFRLFITPRIQ